MEDRLRVVLTIHHELDRDTGAPGATLALGEHLAGLGHQVRYVSFDDYPIGLSYRRAAVSFPALVAARLAALAREGFDVVDASTGDAWLWDRLRPRRTAALVTRSHGLEHLFHERTAEQATLEGRALSLRYRAYWSGWRLWEVRRSLCAADVAMVLNEAEWLYAVERLGVPAERLRLGENGVHRTLLDAGARVAARARAPRIAVLGELRPLKGAKQGISALTRVMRRRPEVEVSFLGAGVGADEVRREFPPDLRPRVCAVRSYHRFELASLLEDHTILLFPSLSEGFSLALIEAMAFGLTPVASNLSAVNRVVAHGDNGLLVPPRDAEGLAAALEQLLEDPERRAAMGARARATAERFAWDAVAARTVDVYREAMARRRSRRRA